MVLVLVRPNWISIGLVFRLYLCLYFTLTWFECRRGGVGGVGGEGG